MSKSKAKVWTAIFAMLIIGRYFIRNNDLNITAYDFIAVMLSTMYILDRIEGFYNRSKLAKEVNDIMLKECNCQYCHERVAHYIKEGVDDFHDGDICYHCARKEDCNNYHEEI